MTTKDTIYGILYTALSTDGSIRMSGGTVGGATESTLQQVRDRLADISGYVDQLESYTASLVTLNTQIEDSTDNLETLITNLNSATDGLEGLISTSNTALSAIQSAVDNLEGYTDGIEASLTSIDGKTLTAGQKTMANSSPVVIASDQSAVPVSGTFWQTTQPVSGTVTANAGTGTFAISAVSLPLPSGAATEAKQDTGNTSLASIDGKLNSLGQKTMANSVPVVISSDQGSFAVTTGQQNSSTSALSSVTASTATTTILSANSSRKAVYLFNDSSSSAAVALSTSASSTAFTHKMGPYGFWELPSDMVWRGAISGIWDVANGAIRVTELT